MTEPWVEGFYGALLKLVQKSHPEAIKVTGWDDNSYETGGCPSCSYTDYEVDIYYTTDNPKLKTHLTYTYNGKFTSLLEELTS
jgi:hypothetical protein